MAESTKYLVSVVIPTYNRARLVSETVQFVFDQKFKDFEVIVVDDGSTDDTSHALERFLSYPNFRYVFQENAGRSLARNHGLEMSNGNYVIFLDSDDVLTEGALESLSKISSNHPASGVVAGNRQFVNEDLSKHWPLEPELSRREYYDQDMSLKNGRHEFFPPSAYLVKRDVALELKGFDSEMEPCEDRDFILRCANVTRFSATSRIVVLMRKHEGNTPEESLRKASIRVKTKHLASFEKVDLDRSRAVARMKGIWLYKIAADHYELGRFREAFKIYFQAVRSYPFLLGSRLNPPLLRQLILSFVRSALPRS